MLDQLVIKEENYLYWTSKDKVKIIIPPELYTTKVQQAYNISIKDKKKMQIKVDET